MNQPPLPGLVSAVSEVYRYRWISVGNKYYVVMLLHNLGPHNLWQLHRLRRALPSAETNFEIECWKRGEEEGEGRREEEEPRGGGGGGGGRVEGGMPSVMRRRMNAAV